MTHLREITPAELSMTGKKPSPLSLYVAWMSAAGKTSARRSRVEPMEGSTFVVRVPGAGWRREIQRHETQIIQSLRVSGIRVNRIECRVDPEFPELKPVDPGMLAPRARRTAGSHSSPLDRLELLRANYLRASSRKTGSAAD